MRVLLVSCYELGHQPLHLASPTAFLRAAGHEVDAVDLALDPLPDSLVLTADVVAIAVPMHTAMRLAERVVAHVRERRGPSVRIVLFGLYAPLCAVTDVDAMVGGEYEEELVRIVANSGSGSARPIVLDRLRFPVPARDLLPPLQRYAHLVAAGGEQRTAGYVEASRGCVHRCRHCPVPAVYDGRIRVVPPDVVVADIAQQAAMGAQHVTIGDPDFLNAVPHALRVLRAAHERLPDLTFDVTAKVSHLLRHAALLPELRRLGVVFAVTAVESLNPRVLDILDKGHTPAGAIAAVRLLRAHDIEVRPSLLPFTPWSTLQDWLDLLDFVHDEDLVDSVDPVQLTIRLLLPHDSLLLAHSAMQPYLDGYDRKALSWRWHHPDPRMDELQAGVASLVAEDADARADARTTHARLREHARHVARESGVEWAGREGVLLGAAATRGPSRPRLTEPWFC